MYGSHRSNKDQLFDLQNDLLNERENLKCIRSLHLYRDGQ